MIRRIALATALAAGAAGALAAPALASQSNELVIEDPKFILNPQLINEVAPEWKKQGVDRVRILVIWGAVSPDRYQRTKPRGFNVANPGPSRSQAIRPAAHKSALSDPLGALGTLPCVPAEPIMACAASSGGTTPPPSGGAGTGGGTATGGGTTSGGGTTGGGTTAPGSTQPPPASTTPTTPGGDRPGGNATLPGQKPAYNWSTIDTAVDAVRRNGMKPMLTLTLTAPTWGSRNPRINADPDRQGAYDPDPRLYAQFAGAVAKRYRSKVDIYLTANEPNQRLFLTPQLNCKRRVRGKCEIVAPHLYRELVRRAYTAIKRNDRSSRVLIGELAPIGATRQNERASIKPMPFLRAFACVDEKYKPVRTGRCRSFRPARGDGFAYHPYAIKDAPDKPQKDLELFKMGDLDRLLAFLDKLTTKRRIIAPGNKFNLWITEYGVETRPPDRSHGVSQLTQSRFLQQAAYIAWANPRVKMHAHYIWQDDPLMDRDGGFQSGLFFVPRNRRSRARPKLALRYFANPFYIDTKVKTEKPDPELDRFDLPRPVTRILDRKKARFWGQVRPGGGATSITLFENGRRIAAARTNGRGFWSLRREAVRGRTYHFEYRLAGKRIRSDRLRVA